MAARSLNPSQEPSLPISNAPKWVVDGASKTDILSLRIPYNFNIRIPIQSASRFGAYSGVLAFSCTPEKFIKVRGASSSMLRVVPFRLSPAEMRGQTEAEVHPADSYHLVSSQDIDNTTHSNYIPVPLKSSSFLFTIPFSINCISTGALVTRKQLNEILLPPLNFQLSSQPQPQPQPCYS